MKPVKRAHPSVCLSLTSSEIRIIFHALSQETSEAASALQEKLAGLIEVEDGADSEWDEAESNCELNLLPPMVCSLIIQVKTLFLQVEPHTSHAHKMEGGCMPKGSGKPAASSLEC